MWKDEDLYFVSSVVSKIKINKFDLAPVELPCFVGTSDGSDQRVMELTGSITA